MRTICEGSLAVAERDLAEVGKGAGVESRVVESRVVEVLGGRQAARQAAAFKRQERKE